MLTELGKKSGCLCQQAKQGDIRCPLIVRSTSEDVITGELFGTLGLINPRWWLPEFLNRALGYNRFRQQVFRNFQIELWQKQPAFPPELIPWKEGHTEVDVVISWENPATTIFVEMKYSAPLSPNTTHNDGKTEFPADQLIRNARVGLHRCGWYAEDRLFEFPNRDFVLILMAPTGENPLVDEYRSEQRLRNAVPNGYRLKKLPRFPFIGQFSYNDMTQILDRRLQFFTATERRLAERVIEYLELKLSQWRKSKRNRMRQLKIQNL